MADDGELLGRAVLELTTDNRPLEAGLLSAERRTALAASVMQATVDRQARQAGTSLGTVGQSIDKQVTPPIGRLATASENMGRRVKQALGGVSKEASQTRGDLAAVDASLIDIARRMPAPSQLAALASARENPAMALSHGATGGGGTTIINNYGGGGGGMPPVAVAAPGGRGGSGGGGLGATLAALLWGGGGRIGGGRLGLGVAGAGAGSVAAFAGLDPLHVLTTLGAVAGSATTAAAGGGLLALGSLGKLAVGGGSDAAVMKSTIADTKTLFTAYGNVTKAVQIYGANSRQAAIAQAQLNQQMKELGPAAGVELALAKRIDKLNTLWDKATAGARMNAVKILDQTVVLGTAYVPRVAAAAQRNLGIINTDIKPLFAWLEGPHGVGVWNNLENNFAKDLPSAVHAFDQGMELLLRVTSLASNYTGGFVAKIDQLLTRLNSKSDQTLNKEIGKLVGDFRMWEALLKAVGQDLYYLFRNDAGTGSAIVVTLTQMLDKLGKWENSTQGRAQIHNIFEIHKGEVLALLHLLPPLLTMFGSIYLEIAPPLVGAFTGILHVITDVITGLGHLSPAFLQVLGGGLILAKLGLLSTTLAAVGGALAGNTTALAENATAASADAGAMSRVAAANAEVAGTSGFTLRPSSSSTATAAGGALLGGSQVAGAAGATEGAVKTGILSGVVNGVKGIVPALLRGGTFALMGTVLAQVVGSSVGGGIGHAVKSIGTDAAIGAGLGSVFGPPGIIPGAIAGALVGGITHFLGSSGADSAAHRFAAKLTSDLPAQIAATVAPKVQHAVSQGHTDRNILAASPATGLGALSPQRARQLTADQQRQLTNLGKTLGQGVTAAMTQAVQQGARPTAAILLNNFHRQFAGLPAVARQAGAAQMLAWAQSLNNQGKLPDAQMKRIIHGLEAQVPGLAAFMRTQGNQMDLTLAQAFRFQHATTALAATLKGYDSQWASLAVSQNVTAGNIVTNTTRAMADIATVISTSTGATRRAAIAEWDQLRSQSAQRFDGMASDLKDRGALMRINLTGETALLARQGAADFFNFVFNVRWLMSQGLLATSRGSKLIATNINAILKTFGEKPLSVPQIQAASPDQLAALSTGQAFVNGAGAIQSAGTAISLHGAAAAGGLFQIGRAGAAGSDTIPMNVGGASIMVGSGEVAAVFNRHQWPDINARLAGEGGLPGFFAKRKRPHYMASGGMVGAWQNVIASAESLGGSGYHGNPIQPYGYSELSVPPSAQNAGSALGHLPYQTRMRIKAGTREVVAAKQDIGAGSSFDPVMGLYPGTVAQLGLSGGEFHVAIERADGQPLTPAGASAAAAAIAQILAPKVKGGGTIGQIVQAALKKEAAAANRYASAHQPAGSAVAVGGGGATSGPGGLASFEGVTMAKWIANELAWATRHGWHGQPTSGYRPGFDPHAPSGSEHALINYPGGAVDFGGYNDPGAYATKLALVQLAARLNYPGPRLQMPIGFHDDGHLSGTGHALGGLIALAGGGITASAAATKTKTPPAHKPAKHKQRHPKGKKPGAIAISSALKTLGLVNPHYAQMLAQLTGNDNTANSLVNALGLLTGLQTTVGDGTGPAADSYQLRADDVADLAPYVSNLAGMGNPLSAPFTPGMTYRQAYAIFKASLRGQQVSGNSAWGDDLADIQQILDYVGSDPAHRFIDQDDMAILGLAQMPGNYTWGQFGAPGSPLDQVEADLDQALIDTWRALIFQGTILDNSLTADIPAFTARQGRVFGLEQTDARRIAGIQARLAKLKLAGDKAAVVEADARLGKAKNNADLNRRKANLRSAISSIGVATAAYRASSSNTDLKSAISSLSVEIANERAQPIANSLYIDQLGAQKAKLSAQLARDTSGASSYTNRLDLSRAGYEQALTALDNQGIAASGSAAISAAHYGLNNAKRRLLEDELRQSLTPIEQNLKMLGGSTTTAATPTGGNSIYGALSTALSRMGTGQSSIENLLQGARQDLPGRVADIALMRSNLGSSFDTTLLNALTPAAGSQGSADQSQTIALLQQQQAQTAQALAVSQAQYKVLADLPLFGGSFDTGGVVPGPAGMPRTIIAHGQEIITPPGQGSDGGTIQVVVLDGAVDVNKIKVIANGEAVKVTHAQSRGAGRALPGAGGGLVRLQ